MHQSKTAEVWIMHFHRTIPLVFADKFHLAILTSPPQTGASNQGGVGKEAIFIAQCVNISKTVRDTVYVPIPKLRSEPATHAAIACYNAQNSLQLQENAFLASFLEDANTQYCIRNSSRRQNVPTSDGRVNH